MSASLLDARTAETAGSGGLGGLDDRPGSGGGGPHGLFGDPARFGLLAFLGTLSMMFAGFTSAYVVRRGMADWQPFSAPPLLWFNTALLLVSSAALERARRRLRAWDLPGTRAWVAATGALGAGFVAGQLLVWRRLAAAGIYLASNPHSSFFFLLSGLHALHLLSALVWFGVVLGRLGRLTLTPGQDGLRLFASYWHFLGALWVYLALLLFAF